MSLFSNLGGSKPFGAATSSSQPSGGLFGSSTATTHAQSGGLFGSAAAPSQPQQGGLFGSATTSSSQPQQQGGLFGSATASSSQPQSNLFGSSFAPKPAASTGGLFGQPAQSQPQQQPQDASCRIWGNPSQQQQQQQKPGTLFGGFGQSAQQQGQQQQQSQQQQNPGLSQSQASQSVSRIWSETETPRQKSVAEQIALIYQKWSPQSPSSSFHAYLYNQVPADSAPFYRPDPSENEEKWEEALRKAPSPDSIPVLVKGFEQLGHRIISQERYLRLLQGRLHEINNGLSDLLRRHDLEISTRAAECRRRHIRLSQKCLALATKTQVLRNRGYALDSAEEELTTKLKQLERTILDPALNGRGEEIWARMVNVRERGRWLQQEFEKAGKTVSEAKESAIDEGVLKQASKILEDYDKQLAHLSKELEQIKTDFEEWEKSKPGNRETKK